MILRRLLAAFAISTAIAFTPAAAIEVSAGDRAALIRFLESL